MICRHFLIDRAAHSNDRCIQESGYFVQCKMTNTMSYLLCIKL